MKNAAKKLDFNSVENQEIKGRFVEREVKACFSSEPQEIFEWWIVTGFFYGKLKAKGHPVLEWGNNYYWGRCTTGQAIMMDGVISEICAEMEILDGQKYSWAVAK